MNEYLYTIRLPASLSDIDKVAASPSLDDDEFAAHQIDFVQKIFGYASFLEEKGRTTPASDAFLGVFVQLFEVLDANSPEDARRCRQQLDQIFSVVFPLPDQNDL